MSAEVRQSSFYLHLLINSVTLCLSLCLSSLPVAQLWPNFCLFINHIFVCRSSFPTFCSDLIRIFLPAHLLSDTTLASLPLRRVVLWCPVPFLKRLEHRTSGQHLLRRCCFDKVQFVHIKDRFSILSFQLLHRSQGPRCSLLK